MTEKIIDQLWNILPVMQIVLSIIGTIILSSVVTSFLPEKHIIFRPKIVVLIISIIVTLLVVETEGITIRTVIFNCILMTGLSVLTFEYLGGQWIIEKFLKPIVDKIAYRSTKDNLNRGSIATIQNIKENK